MNIDATIAAGNEWKVCRIHTRQLLLWRHPLEDCHSVALPRATRTVVTDNNQTILGMQHQNHPHLPRN